MNSQIIARANPLADAQTVFQPQWMTLGGMKLAVQFGSSDAAFATVAGVGDLSFIRRTGVKGPAAAAHLAAAGLPVPEHANSWSAISGGGLVARLGRSEFLIEDGENAVVSAKLDSLEPAAGVYPVMRQDAELVLVGSRVNELLLQTCAFDFALLDLAQHPVVLTSMVGVGVTVVPQRAQEHPAAARPEEYDAVFYRIWCDGTYGAYLWETLVSVARDLGGGPFGHETLMGIVDLRRGAP